MKEYKNESWLARRNTLIRWVVITVWNVEVVMAKHTNQAAQWKSVRSAVWRLSAVVVTLSPHMRVSKLFRHSIINLKILKGQYRGWIKKCPMSKSTSYLQHALMRYIFDTVPEEARTEIVKVFHMRFPGLVPQLQDEEGKGYYTAEQLAKALDIPLYEVNERIEAMIAAGETISLGNGKKLRKVH